MFTEVNKLKGASPHHPLLADALLKILVWRIGLPTSKAMVNGETASWAFFLFPSHRLLSEAHSVLLSLLLLSLPDCQGELKKNQIDLWISAITRVRLLASAEPWVLLSKSFHLSPSQLAFPSIMVFIFACAILFLKYFFKEFLFR